MIDKESVIFLHTFANERERAGETSMAEAARSLIRDDARRRYLFNTPIEQRIDDLFASVPSLQV